MRSSRRSLGRRIAHQDLKPLCVWRLPAGATLVRNWTIKGNSLGLDWDANRNGQGSNFGCVQGGPASGRPRCWHAASLANRGHEVWSLQFGSLRTCSAASTRTIKSSPARHACSFWNVDGVWADLWSCVGAFRHDLDNYLQATNMSLQFNSLEVRAHRGYACMLCMKS